MADRKTGKEKPVPLKGLSAEEMFQKIRQVVNQNTDAEVRMERDGSYKVFAVTKRIV